MKVSPAIRAEFERQDGINVIVERDAQSLIRSKLPKTWHYEGRRKALESFALKIETGRFEAEGLEDFFACTLVVPTLSDIEAAATMVSDLFLVQYRRPKDDKVATSRATDFTFDHLRLFVTMKIPVGLDPQPIHSVTFEVQVKTFLQHAWSIATHNLTYKTNSPSWGKERVAAQAKATLESVEVSIVEAVILASGSNHHLNKSDQVTSDLLVVMDTLVKEFGSELPTDLRRISQNVQELLKGCGLKPASLQALLDEGRIGRGGSHPLNLSPHAVIVQYMLDHRFDKIRSVLTKPNGRLSVFLAPEITLPASLRTSPLPRARQMKRSNL